MSGGYDTNAYRLTKKRQIKEQIQKDRFWTPAATFVVWKYNKQFLKRLISHIK